MLDLIRIHNATPKDADTTNPVDKCTSRHRLHLDS